MRHILFLALILISIYLFTLTDLARYIDSDYIYRYLEQVGYYKAVLLYIIIYTLLTAISVPATALTFVGALLFGQWVGTVVVMIGSTVGAIAALLVARYGLRDFAQSYLKDKVWYLHLAEALERNPLKFIIFVRLIPILPFNGINFAAGLTNIRLIPYSVGSFIGMLPGSFIYVYFSAQYLESFDSGLNLELLFATILLALLLLISSYYSKYLYIKESNAKMKRLPSGQTLTTKFPLLHIGEPPKFDPTSWDFEIFGAVDEPKRLDYESFHKLAKEVITADFHCVTRWSRYDNRWEGISSRTIFDLVKVDKRAKFVMIHSDGDYTTNLPLDEFLHDDVLFAYKHDGVDISIDHGFPLRLVVPKLYAWKSAKWVRKVEFMIEDKRGFWEARGYHNHGDPWKEERYSADEE
ncbi:MAG: molybdopterin-dependent oxidoreductase [Nitrospinota bacterium]